MALPLHSLTTLESVAEKWATFSSELGNGLSLFLYIENHMILLEIVVDLSKPLKEFVALTMEGLDIPKNFSWLEDGKIAALAFPEKREDLEFLVNVGIRYLVTLTKELQPRVEEVPALIGINICVDDYCTFTMEQVKQFIEVCEKAAEEKTVITFLHTTF